MDEITDFTPCCPLVSHFANRPMIPLCRIYLAIVCKYIIHKCIQLYGTAVGYASQHVWCVSQARINWEGCAMKSMRHKNGGDGRDWGTS